MSPSSCSIKSKTQTPPASLTIAPPTLNPTPPTSPTVSSINAALLYELLGAKQRPPTTPTSVRKSYTPLSTPQASRRGCGLAGGLTSSSRRSASRASDTSDSETPCRVSRVAPKVAAAVAAAPPPAKRRTTVARANRTLDLRRARLSGEGVTASGMGVSTKSRPTSRESTGRTPISKATTAAKSANSKTVSSARVRDPSLNRRDGGRFSMRLAASNTVSSVDSTSAARRRTKEVGTCAASPAAVKAAKCTLARSRSNAESATADCNAGTSAAANSWRRRKGYDPRRAVNEAKVLQRHRRPSDASSEKSSDFGMDKSLDTDTDRSLDLDKAQDFDFDKSLDCDEMSERIKKLSCAVSHDILALTQDVQVSSSEVS